MKIAYISDLSPPKKIGGAETVMNMEAIGMARNGHDVHIISLGPYPEHMNEERIEDSNLSFHFLGKGLWDIYSNPNQANKLMTAALGICNPIFARRIRAILADLRADIVHSHYVYRISYGAVATALNSESTWVHTFHDYLFECTKGSLLRASDAVCDYPPLLCRTRNRMFRLMFGQPDAVIAISSYIKGRLVRAGFEEKSLFLIPNPITPRKMPEGDMQSAPFLLYVGRLEPCKGIVAFADEFSRIDDANIRLVIAGSGPMENELRRISARSIPRIEVAGRVPDKRLIELYASCRAVVFPSVWPEVLPLVPLEANSFGKPVIATSIGGTTDIIHDGENGYLVPPGDQKLAVEKSLQLLRNESDARRMGDLGRALSTSFSTEEHINRLTELYCSVSTR